ncbi:MAG: hypothetical protein NWS66_05245 [Saprospiraceae bacterium]|nr:hypothetical protein [Saprospiraceae bacterium]MDP4699331.1 hypothetical protein [Saprospiraceae bacterium]MDP4812140.1 hypothetical protein [Saprospiraceae bacterium]MDP4814857.1 hypothetical protein [Saprospiraceae bacterium]MDP4915673.1 hypothetical protein [Saprospiraceae bacterium]
MYPRLLTLFLLLNLVSCKNNDAEVLHNEIMDIHDEVMPKTGEITYLYMSFRKKVETDSTISEENKMELLKQADDLEKAEDEMMVWMNDYIPPHKMRSSKNEKQIIDYLQNQKKIISDIKVHTNASLASGKKWKEMLSINN